LWLALTYLAALAAAVILISAATKLTGRSAHPLWIAACADLAATLVVYGFSYALNNSSLYDPYWSIAPPLLGLYWAAIARPGQGHPVRRLAVLALVGVWAVRLTWNCLRRWGGLKDEDWRYRDLRAKHPRAYWWISLIGLHLMPTLVVYLGCLALYTTLSAVPRPLNGLDAAALIVTGGAIWVEARADWELWRYRGSR
jgi:steroid 5-alpha reductase family enzyme